MDDLKLDKKYQSTHSFQSDKAYSSPAVETALRVFSKLSTEQKIAKCLTENIAHR